MAADGYYLLVNYDSNREEAQKTLDTIRSAGGEGELMQCDVSDPQQVKQCSECMAEKNEGKFIEVLVNNAGLTKDNLMIFMSDAEWEEVIATNQHSFFYVTRHLLQKCW